MIGVCVSIALMTTFAINVLDWLNEWPALICICAAYSNWIVRFSWILGQCIYRYVFKVDEIHTYGCMRATFSTIAYHLSSELGVYSSVVAASETVYRARHWILFYISDDSRSESSERINIDKMNNNYKSQQQNNSETKKCSTTLEMGMPSTARSNAVRLFDCVAYDIRRDILHFAYVF